MIYTPELVVKNPGEPRILALTMGGGYNDFDITNKTSVGKSRHASRAEHDILETILQNLGNFLGALRAPENMIEQDFAISIIPSKTSKDFLGALRAPDFTKFGAHTLDGGDASKTPRMTATRAAPPLRPRAKPAAARCALRDSGLSMWRTRP